MTKRKWQVLLILVGLPLAYAGYKLGDIYIEWIPLGIAITLSSIGAMDKEGSNVR